MIRNQERKHVDVTLSELVGFNLEQVIWNVPQRVQQRPVEQLSPDYYASRAKKCCGRGCSLTLESGDYKIYTLRHTAIVNHDDWIRMYVACDYQ